MDRNFIDFLVGILAGWVTCTFVHSLIYDMQELRWKLKLNKKEGGNEERKRQNKV